MGSQRALAGNDETYCFIYSRRRFKYWRVMKSMYRESFRVLLIGYMRETDVVGTYIFYIG